MNTHLDAGAAFVADSDLKQLLRGAQLLDEWPFLAPPTGYPDSLALCIIDSIWSMGVRYGQVENVVKRYGRWVREERGGDPKSRGADELCHDIEAAGGAATFAMTTVKGGVVGNRTLTSRKGGILKAEAVLRAAQALTELSVNTTTDLRAKYEDPDIEAAWRAVTGQGSGISWRYLLMNASIEDVKPDRMICRWVQRTLNQPTLPTPSEAHQVLCGAHPKLAASARLEQSSLIAAGATNQPLAPPTLRALDHAIWSWERRQARLSAR